MSNDLMIPDKASVPAYVRNAEAARIANEEAAAGISTGMPPRIKLSQKSFIMVDGSGDEKPFPVSKLFIPPGEEQQYLPIVIIRAKVTFSKQWYSTPWNPSEEGKQPDCFSHDAVRPDPLALAPQCETCAACPNNQFGTGKDQANNPTKGKACSDNKILAVFVPGFGINMLRVPPDSLKGFGVYVKSLSAAGVPLAYVTTLLGFDPTVTTPRLVFKFGGYLPEDRIPKIEEMKALPDTAEIIGITPSAGAPALTAPPVNQQADVKAAAEKKAKEAAAAAAANTVIDMDLGMDSGGTVTATAANHAPASGGIADADLIAALGLPGLQ